MLATLYAAATRLAAPLLRVHGRAGQSEALGRRITGVLRDRFDLAERAMLADLGQTTLAELAANLHVAVSAEH